MTFKDKYKEELLNIGFAADFEKKTVELLKAAQREDDFVSNKRKTLKVIVLAIAAIVILSFSAFAIISFLSASQVADRVGERELAVLFEENSFEPQTIKGEVYSVTFMGTVPAESFYAYEEDGILVSENRIYAVWAVYKNDGTPLNLADGSPIQVIPVADGYRPDAFFNLGMSSTGTEKDGILYYLFDYTDLEVFADKSLSLIAFEGMFPTADILTVNSNGEIVYADSYNGFKGSFELKLDESKADPEAAAELMSQF